MQLNFKLTSILFFGTCIINFGFNLFQPLQAAAQMDNEKYYSISSFSVREVIDPAEITSLPFSFSTPNDLSPLPLYNLRRGTQYREKIDSNDPDPSFSFFEGLINLGKSIWSLVEINKPVANIQVDVANVLPMGIKSWQELEGWRFPISKLFRVNFTNSLGMNVVDYTYRVLYTPGGQLNGKGLYLTNITAVPADLSVSWGFNFSSQVQILNITNAGSTSNPIGAAELLVSWKVDSSTTHLAGSSSYYVRGDGAFKDLSSNEY